MRRLPYGLIWMCVWLLGLELVARRAWTPSTVGSDTYAKYDASYGYGFEFVRPQCMRSSSNDVRCYRTQYRAINEQRFRLRKRGNTVRFFTVGDSHAAGGNEAYTHQLVQLLKNSCPMVDWQGINLAVGAQGSRRALLMAQQVRRFRPDFLILDFGGTNEYEEERDSSYRDQMHSGVWSVLLRSHAVVLGRKLFSGTFEIDNARVGTPEAERDANKDPANHERWLAQLSRNYREIARLTEADRTELYVVGRALYNSINPKSAALPRDQLFRSLAGPHTRLIDAHTIFHKWNKRVRRKLFIRDRNHYSRRGHQAIAEALRDSILRDLQLPELALCR